MGKQQHVGFGDVGNTSVRRAESDGDGGRACGGAGSSSRSAAIARGWETRRKHKAEGGCAGGVDKKMRKAKSVGQQRGEGAEADDEGSTTDNQQ